LASREYFFPHFFYQMGVTPVGTRRRLAKAIELFTAQRESAKATAVLGALEARSAGPPPGGVGSMEQRLSSIREVISSVLPSAGRR